MISQPVTVTVPLRVLDDGTIRVGETRVLLELVIHAFQRGATPESIVQSYPSLKLSDVYTVLGYYLENREAVDEYVRDADEEGERKRIEALERNPDLVGLRERLLARLAARRGSDDLTRHE